MNRLTSARTVPILCLVALVAEVPAIVAIQDDQCRMAAAGVQPARRVLKALGVVGGNRIYRDTAPMAGDTTIDASIAAGMNSTVVLSVELDGTSDATSHWRLRESEGWPAASALFPAAQAPSAAPDDLR